MSRSHQGLWPALDLCFSALQSLVFGLFEATWRSCYCWHRSLSLCFNFSCSGGLCCCSRHRRGQELHHLWLYFHKHLAGLRNEWVRHQLKLCWITNVSQQPRYVTDSRNWDQRSLDLLPSCLLQRIASTCLRPALHSFRPSDRQLGSEASCCLLQLEMRHCCQV